MFRLFCLTVLFILSAVDIYSLMVPDAGCMLLLGAVLIYTQPEELLSGLPASAAIWGLCGLSALLCSRFGKPAPFGLGDVKLLSILALGLPPAELLKLLALASLLSGAFAAVLLLFRKAAPGTEIPFVPFITAGYAAVSFLS